jgi:hypothetical protein
MYIAIIIIIIIIIIIMTVPLNVTSELLSLLHRIRKFLGSNLGLQTGYAEIFHDYPLLLQTNAGKVLKTRPRPLPPTSFPTC